MAFRFGEYVVRGEISNRKNYKTYGLFELAGEEMPIQFELTGNCSPDLRGKRIYFEAVPPPKPPDKPLDLQHHLVGPTGTITAAGWVKHFDCSVEEFMRRSELGEPPPMYWTRRLYFEFFCQHGRVVIELAGPKLEYDAGDGDEEEWRPLPPTEPMPELDPNSKPADSGGPEIIMFDSSGHTERIDPREYIQEDREGAEPDELQRKLDRQAREIEQALGSNEQSEDEFLAEMELIENEEGEPVAWLFDKIRQLQHPDEIAEDEIEPLLKALLGELAFFGVALHVCEHFSLRDTYRLLYEKMNDEWRVHPELAGTGWVQNYMTCEYCKACEEELDREFEERERAPKAEKEEKDKQQQQ